MDNRYHTTEHSVDIVEPKYYDGMNKIIAKHIDYLNENNIELNDLYIFQYSKGHRTSFARASVIRSANVDKLPPEIKEEFESFIQSIFLWVKDQKWRF